MEAGNVNEFLDKITYQDEVVLFHNEKYFFNRWSNNLPTGTTWSFEIDVVDDHRNCKRVAFEISGDSIEYCMEKLLAAPIWAGKTFWEAEKEMIWDE
jgi:hypothetical protein